MTTKAEWLALAERAEKATGPDREIEEVISCLIYGWTKTVVFIDPFGDCPMLVDTEGNGPCIADEYTACLDAITALIERDLPGWMLTLYWPTKTHGPRAVLVSPDYRKQIGADAQTVPNAACNAFCRAMAEKAGE